MSYFFHTIPQNIALMLKDKYQLEVFVETGSYLGATAEWASKHFARIYTIESDEEYYRQTELRLLNIPNAFPCLGDSRLVLHEVFTKIGLESTMFYLDAHWSEWTHYGRPLIDSSALEEVEIINQWEETGNNVIIIDDAHRFGTEKWPTMEAIVEALENNGMREARVLLDVLIAVPRRMHSESFDVATASFVQN